MTGCLEADILEGIRTQIAVLALDGRVLYVNKAWEQRAWIRREEGPDTYLGLNYLRALEEMAKTGDPHTIEMRDCLLAVMMGDIRHQKLIWRHKRKEIERWYETHINRHQGQGDAIIIVNCIDVTDKVLTESANDLSRAKLERTNRELDLALARERHLSGTDALTGIGNRRRFFDLALHTMAEADRYDSPTTLMLFDVDNFKHINDTVGHLQGDEILRHVAQNAADKLREADVLARYGGDEFIALLPRTDCKEAFNVGCRIIEDVRLYCGCDTHPPIDITVSMGFAEYPRDAGDLEGLISCADKALYEAKRAGRNRGIIFTQVS